MIRLVIMLILMALAVSQIAYADEIVIDTSQKEQSATDDADPFAACGTLPVPTWGPVDTFRVYVMPGADWRHLITMYKFAIGGELGDSTGATFILTFFPDDGTPETTITATVIGSLGSIDISIPPDQTMIINHNGNLRFDGGTGINFFLYIKLYPTVTRL